MPNPITVRTLRRDLVRWLLALVPAAAAAQSPVVITPGATTFGPPKPVNGECPSCHTKHAPISATAGTGYATSEWSPAGTGTNGLTFLPVLVRCKFCSAAFYQDPEFLAPPGASGSRGYPF